MSRTGRYIVLLAAFFGWLLAGFQLQITSLAMRSASIDLLGRSGRLDRARYKELTDLKQAHQKVESKKPKSERKPFPHEPEWEKLNAPVKLWFSFCVVAFLLGAAAGGYVFGRLGDRIGRATAMALAILSYSILSGATWLVQTPEQLLILRFFTCMGVGGMWPNGVALVAEAWSNFSRPMIAGLIGTSANVGIFIMATLGRVKDVTPDEWRWVMLVGASPIVLGFLCLFFVPESPSWLTSQSQEVEKKEKPSASAVFRSPYLGVTILGIILATIPLMGGWGVANWMMPWADQEGPPGLKAQVAQARSFTGTVASLLGGIIASYVGRRRSYFLSSLLALFCAQYIFWTLNPTDDLFLWWVGALGFFSGFFFGWLPLFLPELFPTSVRSTGAGVSFNFGRILTAFAVLFAGTLASLFGGNYAQIGRVTSLFYAIGLIAIWFAPDTSQRQLDDNT